MKPDYEIKSFKSADEWRKWLEANHVNKNGIWIKIYKKGSGLPTVTIEECLDNALCFDWIDGQRKSNDEVSYLQKFTPRRKSSLWSKRNIEYIERLTTEGLMMPAGTAEVERAKADGRWAAAYDKPSEAVAPKDFLAVLHKYPVAEENFNALNKTNKYAIVWQLQTAKTEITRQRRIDKILTMLKNGEKLY